MNLDKDHFLLTTSHTCAFPLFWESVPVWFLPGDSAASWNCLGVPLETRSGSEEIWLINESAFGMGAHRGLGPCGRSELLWITACFRELEVSAGPAWEFSHSRPAEGLWGPGLTLLKFSEFSTLQEVVSFLLNYLLKYQHYSFKKYVDGVTWIVFE